MSRYEIVDKLNIFLSTGLPDTEPNAVYLLVQLRKVLDHAYSNPKSYSLLRFYCDWIVHTEKNRNLTHIAPLVQQIYDDVKVQIEKGPLAATRHPGIVQFIYMEELRNEMEGLFKKENLPLDLFQKAPWVAFIATVVQVLTNQPILNPIPEVPRLVLTPANPGCICGIMEFAQPITSYDGKTYSYYDFKNAY